MTFCVDLHDLKQNMHDIYTALTLCLSFYDYRFGILTLLFQYNRLYIFSALQYTDSSTNPVQVLRIDCEAPMTTERTTTISTQATESVISSTMRTTGDVTISDPTTDTSKKFENPPMTTDPTTGNYIIMHTVNHNNTKAKGQLKYSILNLAFNFLNSTSAL